jgi:hypothetical protein
MLPETGFWNLLRLLFGPIGRRLRAKVEEPQPGCVDFAGWRYYIDSPFQQYYVGGRRSAETGSTGVKEVLPTLGWPRG